MNPQQQNDNSIDVNSSSNVADNNHSMQLPQIPNTQYQQPPTSMQLNPISNPSNSSTGIVDTPVVAEDGDLIEKEWVNKAKKIVEKTKNDPSQQNVQLNKFKADYLKMRFNKDIKPMDG